MAEGRGNAGGLGVGHADGEGSSEDPAAVHRERRQEIEDRQRDVDEQDPLDQRHGGDVEVVREIRLRSAGGCINQHPKGRCDHDVDGWTGEGDQEFLPGIVGHALEAGDASDGQESDVPGPDAEALRGQCVTEFVQDDAGKEGEDKQGVGEDGFGVHAACEAGDDDPDDEESKREMDLYADSGDGGEIEGPAHGRAPYQEGEQFGRRRAHVS